MNVARYGRTQTGTIVNMHESPFDVNAFQTGSFIVNTWY